MAMPVMGTQPPAAAAANGEGRKKICWVSSRSCTEQLQSANLGLSSVQCQSCSPMTAWHGRQFSLMT